MIRHPEVFLGVFFCAEEPCAPSRGDLLLRGERFGTAEDFASAVFRTFVPKQKYQKFSTHVSEFFEIPTRAVGDLSGFYGNMGDI